MSNVPWYQEAFGPDYMSLYGPGLPEERSQREAMQIVGLMKLKQGSTILDLCCGQGRHSVAMAANGYNVTGLDLSTHLLEEARRVAQKRSVSVRWIHSDMCAHIFESEFDAVINVYSSFGYYKSIEADRRTLATVRRALRPGGLFLLETYQPYGHIPVLTPVLTTHFNNGTIVSEERRFDPILGRANTSVEVRHPDGTLIQHTYSIRLYTVPELTTLCQSVGLHPIAYYANFAGETLSLSSPRVVLIASKCGSPE